MPDITALTESFEVGIGSSQSLVNFTSNPRPTFFTPVLSHSIKHPFCADPFLKLNFILGLDERFGILISSTNSTLPFEKSI